AFRHDVKNHISIVKELVQNGDIDTALQYMSDMENLTADMSFPVSTNNPVLDILIGNKLGIAKSNQIEVQCSFISCMIIRKLIITYFLSFNIVVQYNSDTMDF
uniref:hypothetical protein n=1 Tax=Streptococcus sp. TaxID=1306 RepID=UPI003A9561E4